eukprot:scaffold441770_cov46-Prasinocladus_malaysianus.AAC.1
MKSTRQIMLDVEGHKRACGIIYAYAVCNCSPVPACTPECWLASMSVAVPTKRCSQRKVHDTML